MNLLGFYITRWACLESKVNDCQILCNSLSCVHKKIDLSFGFLNLNNDGSHFLSLFSNPSHFSWQC